MADDPARAFVCARFSALYGAEPEAVFLAPGRVNLIGEHTDYNDGFVLPAAINYGTRIAARRRNDGTVRAIAGNCNDAVSSWQLAIDRPVAKDARHDWANYLRGVSEQFRRHAAATGGMDIYLHGDVPAGAGLSSSAALCAGFALAIDELYSLQTPVVDMARHCQAAEHEFLDSRCGIMDSLISLRAEADHALLIDCRKLSMTGVPMPPDAALVVVDSRIRHTHAGGQYNDRRSECEAAAQALNVASLRDASLEQLDAARSGLTANEFRRARHVISENARTLSAARALAAGNYARLGALMQDSQDSMRTDFEISTPEIDLLVNLIAQQLAGSGGARMTGGGFGGSVIAIAPRKRASAIGQAVAERYYDRTGLKAQIYRCHASAGARRLAGAAIRCR